MKNECVIIAGYAGLGKTTLEKKYEKVVDVESSYFKWLPDGLEGLSAEERKGLTNRKLNPAFPQNYIDEIKKLRKTNKILLVYIASEVRELLDKEGIEYIVALPSLDSKNTLVKRLKARGNNQSFIDGFCEKFDKIPEKYKNLKHKIIYVQKDEYLEDALRREHLLDGIKLKQTSSNNPKRAV